MAHKNIFVMVGVCLLGLFVGFGVQKLAFAKSRQGTKLEQAQALHKGGKGGKAWLEPATDFIDKNPVVAPSPSLNEILKWDGTKWALAVDETGSGDITGSGTANYVAKFTGTKTIGNSIIYDNGSVGIGTTSPGAKLEVNGGAGAAIKGSGTHARGIDGWSEWGVGVYGYSEHGWGVRGECGGGPGSYAGYFVGPVALSGYLIVGSGSSSWKLSCDGNAAKPGGGSWSDISDIRCKKNVKTLDGALDKMLKLRGVTFEWKEPEKHWNMTGTQMNMVAQEVEKVFPQWVDTDKDGYKILTFRGFEALTVEAIKELKAENEALKARIETLEARLNVK